MFLNTFYKSIIFISILEAQIDRHNDEAEILELPVEGGKFFGLLVNHKYLEVRISQFEAQFLYKISIICGMSLIHPMLIKTKCSNY